MLCHTDSSLAVLPKTSSSMMNTVVIMSEHTVVQHRNEVVQAWGGFGTIERRFAWPLRKDALCSTRSLPPQAGPVYSYLVSRIG